MRLRQDVLDTTPLQVAAGSVPAAAGADILDIELLQRALAENRLRVFPHRVRRPARLGQAHAQKSTERGRQDAALADQSEARKDEDGLASHEIACLNKLRRCGFVTPEVVFRNANYVVLSDIGPSLETVLTLASPDDVSRWCAKAAETLRQSARCGALARCSTHAQHDFVRQDRIGFIDLENTVENWMPLLMRQGWDLYQLGQSAAFFEPGVSHAEAAMRAYGPGRVRKLLYAAAVSLFGTYVALYPFRNGRKREIRQGHACIRAVYRAPRKAPAAI